MAHALEPCVERSPAPLLEREGRMVILTASCKKHQPPRLGFNDQASRQRWGGIGSAMLSVTARQGIREPGLATNAWHSVIAFCIKE